MNRITQVAQSWLGRLVVLGAFVGIPLAVWWIASPLLGTKHVGEATRGLMTTLILASVVFGLTSAWMVWRDLDAEP
ncbi:MAG: hypothetical protein H6734_02030 [Alphaproteobacteria bacterium]|nr:hypothetical protein [Alphaproteobacteria bacterium]